MMFLAVLQEVLHIVQFYLFYVLYVSFLDKYLVLLLSFMFRYTPISSPDSKGYFDLLVKVSCYKCIFSLSFISVHFQRCPWTSM